jgi:hypothetical protein
VNLEHGGHANSTCFRVDVVLAGYAICFYDLTHHRVAGWRRVELLRPGPTRMALKGQGLPCIYRLSTVRDVVLRMWALSRPSWGCFRSRRRRELLFSTSMPISRTPSDHQGTKRCDRGNPLWSRLRARGLSTFTASF